MHQRVGAFIQVEQGQGQANTGEFDGRCGLTFFGVLDDDTQPADLAVAAVQLHALAILSD